MQLKIKSGTFIKDYTLTSAYAKPYVNIANSSVLPLTTNTITGMQLKFKIGNQTYRALEYKGTSSASYLTTADEARKLTNATALTRVSTSDTKYSTRVSTSDTEYLTRVSTSDTKYLTKSGGLIYSYSVSNSSYRNGHWAANSSDYHYNTNSTLSYKMSYGTPDQFRGSGSNGWGSSVTLSFWNSNRSVTMTTGYSLVSGKSEYYVNAQYNVSTTRSFVTTNTVTSNSATVNYVNTSVFFNDYASNTWGQGWDNGKYITGAAWSLSYYPPLGQNWEAIVEQSGCYYSDLYTDSGYKNRTTYKLYWDTETTSTQYLTRASTYSTEYKTRVSTYSTDYKTRVSTSGWTGQSSSSYWLSTSATYLTTRNYSEGLSSTTALTRVSTSSIEYLTRVSTSSIDYLTRVSTSSIDYLTRISTSGTSPLTAPGNLILESLILSTTSSGHGAWGWDAAYGESLWKNTNISYSRWFTLKTEWETDDQHYLTQDGYYSSYNNWIGSVSYTMQHRNNLTTLSCDQYSGVTHYDTDTYRRSIRTTSGINANISSSTTGGYCSSYIYDVRDSNTYDTDYYRWARATSQTGYCETFFNWRSSSYDPSAYSKYHAVTGVPNFQMIQEITGDWYDGGLYAAANYSRESRRTTIRFYQGTKTTGTSYLTRVSTYDTKYYTCASTSSTRYYTCVSTSATNYYTRSSTSGYSGVSSSSDVAHGEWV